MTGNYVKTIYDPQKRPVTDYPDRLAGYILSRYHIKPHAAILDSGSGRGDFARAFARKGKTMDMDVWAIDGSHYEKAKDGGVNFIGDFDLETGRLPFADNRFDLVFSKSVLEHIHKPRQYLAEIYRVLKPGGVFVALVPDCVRRTLLPAPVRLEASPHQSVVQAFAGNRRPGKEDIRQYILPFFQRTDDPGKREKRQEIAWSWDFLEKKPS